MSTPETPQPVLPYIRPEIAVLPPYKQGTQADGQAFKLSSNENPFEPLPGVLSAVRAEASIHRYPDATAGRLRAALAERFGVDIDSVHIGSGSVAIIAQFMLAVSAPGDEIMFAWRSFEAYPGLALVAGAAPVQVPLTDDSRHDLPAMLAAITDRTRAVIICSPNNPTGPAVTQAEFDDFLAQVPPTVLVILDEAYVEFVTQPGAVNGASMIAAGAPANLVVLRTFSKAYGLAGLRVGYAIGHPRVLDAARSTGIPLSVTAQAETGALASLAAEAELLERVREIAQRRDEMVTALRAQGWRVPDAQGNFVWLATGAETMAAAETFLQAGLVVRAFDGEGIRISVGEHMSVEKVLLAARGIVDNLPDAHPARR